MHYNYFFIIIFSIAMITINVLANNSEQLNLSNPFLEIGYTKINHFNKLNHFENLDFDTGKDIQGYRKRKLKNSDAFYAHIGIKFYKKFRFGLEYIQTGKSKLHLIDYIQSVDEFNSYSLYTNQKTILLNINYHPTNWGIFSPYLGVGIGASRNKVSEEVISLNYNIDLEPEGKRFKNTVTKLAWSLQAGVQYKLSNNLYLNTSYKFIDFGSIKGSSSEHNYIRKNIEEGLPINIKGHLCSHLLMLGLGYQF